MNKEQEPINVYISYSWSQKSMDVAVDIDNKLSNRGFKIIRDKKEAGYKSDLIDFMGKLAQGEKVIVIISDEYLKSDNCMRELVGLEKSGRLAERIYPIVIPGTNFYSPEDKLLIMRHWEQSVEELQAILRGGNLNYTKSIIDHLDLRSEIRRNLDSILETLTRLNSLALKDHQEGNYQILEDALRGSASNKQQKSNYILKEGYKSYSSGENEIIESTVSFFSRRMRMAFPGQRGLVWINDPEEAVRRLNMLFKSPFSFEKSKENPDYEEAHNWVLPDPIWWWRGGSSMHIDEFEVLSPTKVRLGFDECEISRIASFRSNRSHTEFIYVETKADKPTGLYQNSEVHIKELAEELGYYSEEYAVLGDKLIKREEYDDGYAMIEGNVVETYGSQLRQRYLTPYNFFISAKLSGLNNRDFDRKSRTVLDQAIKGNVSPDGLLSEIESLPKYNRRY